MHPKGRNKSLDGLRAFSMLWVLAFHMIYFLSFFLKKDAFQVILDIPFLNLFLTGHYGVDIFFTMSGFLIGSILLKEYFKKGSINLIKFFVKRSLRLLPVYYLVLIIALFLPLPNKENIWANFIYVNNYLPFPEQFFGPSWTLAVEEQFYLICPFLILFLGRFKKSKVFIWTLISIIISSIAIRFYLVLDHEMFLPAPIHSMFDTSLYYEYCHTLYLKTHTRFGPLVLGVLAAFIVQRKKSYLNKLSPWIINSTIIGIISYIVFGTYLNTAYSFSLFFSNVMARHLFSVAIVLIIFKNFTETKKQKSKLISVLSSKCWLAISQLSYSMYLFHIFVIMGVYQIFFKYYSSIELYQILILSVVCIFLTAIIATPIWLFVEKPFVNLYRKNKLRNFRNKDSLKEATV